MAQMNVRTVPLTTCVTIFAILFIACLAKGQTSASLQSETTLSLKSKSPLANAWEFRTAPIAFAANWYTLDASFLTSSRISTGPAVVVFNASKTEGNMFTPNYRGYALGWNANYFSKNAFQSSFYLSGHAYYEKYDSYPHAVSSVEQKTGFRGTSAVGYRWKNSAFSLITGAGLEYRHHDTLIIKKSATTGTVFSEEKEIRSFWMPHIEVKVGYEI